MTNIVKLSGSMMSNPDLRTTKTNKSFATFRLSVDRENSTFKDYINCICWDNDLAKNLANTLTENDEVLVEGSMQSNRYTNNQGTTCYTYEVVVNKFQLLKKAPVSNATQVPTNAAPTTTVPVGSPFNQQQAPAKATATAPNINDPLADIPPSTQFDTPANNDFPF